MRGVFVFLFLLALSKGFVSAEIKGDPDSPEFVTATFLVAAPGEAIYQISGHAVIELECPSANLDYVFSFESEDAGGAFMQLFRHVYGRVVAIPPDEYMRQFSDDGRAVYALPLNLSPKQKRELWRVLDTRIVAAPEKFNIRTRHCASMLLEAINEAVRPGHIEVVGSEIIGREDMRVVDAGTPIDGPWRNLALRLAMGNVCDTNGGIGVQTLPMVLLQEWQHYRIIYPDGTSVPLFGGAPEVLVPGCGEVSAPFLTPLVVALILLVASVLACLLQWRGRLLPLVRAVDVLLFVLVTVGGILLVIALSTPARIGTFANWNLILLNPLLVPVMLLLHRRRTAYRRFCGAYAALLVLYAVAGPLLTLSIVMPLSLFALAVAARMIRRE